MSDDLKCVSGCVAFYGGEKRHHKDCPHYPESLTKVNADRIDALIAERERLALAICGGEDAPGYANAQTVEALEEVARDNHNATMEQINRTLALEDKLAKAVEALNLARPHVANNAQGWSIGRAASRADLTAIDTTLAEIKGSAPRRYMGQIMAECDCQREGECLSAERCLAELKGEPK
jgi:hypothetical protein